MKIKILKAFHGDSILISIKDSVGIPKNILIDGGPSSTYSPNKKKKETPELLSALETVRAAGEKIDLLIITHIDDDHIDGILKWFAKDQKAPSLIGEVWFNSGKSIAQEMKIDENPDVNPRFIPEISGNTSISQGIDLENFLIGNNKWNGGIIEQGHRYQRFGLCFRVLSPDRIRLEQLVKVWKKSASDLNTAAAATDYSKSIKDHIAEDIFIEDNQYPNGSSIAFILSDHHSNFLFLGDAHPSVVAEGLKGFGYSKDYPLKALLVKISHHGSKGNTSHQLLELLDARDYIVSTNGDLYHHPHKQMLARLIDHKKDCRIYFNYPHHIDLVFSDQDRKDFPDFKSIPITSEFELE